MHEWIPCRSTHPEVGRCTLEHGHRGRHSVAVRHTRARGMIALATWAAPSGAVWIVAV